MFKLKPNWWEVLRYAWSVRLIVLAGLLQGLEVAIPYRWLCRRAASAVRRAVSPRHVRRVLARLVAQKGGSDAAPDQK
jgi:hypothetical protein